jgi:hypothetical protein
MKSGSEKTQKNSNGLILKNSQFLNTMLRLSLSSSLVALLFTVAGSVVVLGNSPEHADPPEDADSSGGGDPPSSGCLTFPRTADDCNAISEDDQPDSDGIYHYKIDSISLSGDESLTVNPDNDEKVYFYVSGDITVSGNSNIRNEDKPENFRIYGKPDDGDAPDQTFSLNGNVCVHGLFYAPDALMGINGGGNGCSGGKPNERYNIYGAVWVKEWGLSNANPAGINVPDDLAEELDSDLKFSEVNESGAISTWQREKAE